MATPLNNSLLRGFAILRMFDGDRPEIDAAAVQAELGLNTATAHRFLATLEAAGAIVTVRRGRYRLGPAVSDLGRLADATDPVGPAVRPLVNDLARRLSESVMLCRLGRAGPTCLVVSAPQRPITVGIRVGTSLSLLDSAQGRLWLAEFPRGERTRIVEAAGIPGGAARLAALGDELDRIAVRGVAINRGDVEPDIGAVAVAVRTLGDRLAYTLSAFGPVGRFTTAFVAGAEPALNAAATQIGRMSGKPGPPTRT